MDLSQIYRNRKIVISTKKTKERNICALKESIKCKERVGERERNEGKSTTLSNIRMRDTQTRPFSGFDDRQNCFNFGNSIAI